MLLISILAAAAAAPSAAGPSAAAAIEPPADANLFVYRDHAEPLLFTPTVKVDGRKVAGLGQKQFTALRLPPGDHVVEVNWPIFARQLPAMAQVKIVEGGAPHYLEIMATSRYAFGRAEISSGLDDQSADLGAARLRACCHFKPPR